MLDLTPFGFTPTESNAYGALLELGPSSGYAVARALSIARANAYQALDGLVAKGAAVLVSEESPRRFRAVQPRAVFAGILAAETRKLDQLEEQMLAQPQAGATPRMEIRGERALTDLAVRAIVRSDGDVLCVAHAGRLETLAPALRARAAAGKSTHVWAWGAVGEEFPVSVIRIGTDPPAAGAGGDIMLLVADGALAATFGSDPEGVWSEGALHVAIVTAAIGHLTATQPSS
jgi:sugar-specific transcriptional regulator TrmB